MILSNLRKETIDDTTYLKVDYESHRLNKKNGVFWFSINKDRGDWFADDSYDAFMVWSLFLSMYLGEDIEIKGSVTKSILRNLNDFIIPVVKSLYPDFHNIKIIADSYGEAKKNGENIIGTGFSGGVDSFSTIIDRYENEEDPEYRLNTLFFFNLGQYAGKTAEIRRQHALNFFNNSKLFSDEIGLPIVFLDCNMFDFYLPHWEYDAGPLCRIAAILSLQRGITKYYSAGSNHYIQQNQWKEKHLDDLTDTFIYYMCSPKGLEIILDGNQYFRHEKIEKIIDYDYVKRHLNVCVSSGRNVLKDKNCSGCHKCLRTLSALDALGRLQEFNQVFDLEKYAKLRVYYKNYLMSHYGDEPYDTENVDFAKKHGIKFPSKLAAILFIDQYRLRRKLKETFGKR